MHAVGRIDIVGLLRERAKRCNTEQQNQRPTALGLSKFRANMASLLIEMRRR
jgi:hypothetical protein